MRTVSTVVLLALSCVLAIPCAFAADTGQLLPLDPVRNQQAQILAGVQAKSGIYASLTEREREQLLTRQARMLKMIEGKQMSAELVEAEKIELFNTLEWIEAVVNHADDDRMVCERRTVVGSNLKQRVCMTIAQKRIASDLARENLTRGQEQALR